MNPDNARWVRIPCVYAACALSMCSILLVFDMTLTRNKAPFHIIADVKSILVGPSASILLLHFQATTKRIALWYNIFIRT